MMPSHEFVKEVAAELEKYQLSVTGKSDSYQQLHKTLSQVINHLITNDFARFISVLYRLDISEKKVKELLSNEMNIPAGDTIAELIIQRQITKIENAKNL